MDDLLQAILAKLSRGDAPDSKYPDAKGNYSCLCPYHQDTHTGNFSVSERGYKCFACNESGGLRKLAEHLGIPAAPARPHGCTLQAYAEAKKLPPGFLRELGLYDDWYDNGHTKRPAIAIPYKGEAGQLLALRTRKALQKLKNGKDYRFTWRKGDKVKGLLYGLWRLAEIRKAGWVLLVEGESDCHTAWLLDIPALGVPGAAMWSDGAANHLDGLDVFVWREPDNGGRTLVSAVSKSLPTARIITPEGVKDLSEAHIKGLDVVALVAELKAKAAPIAQADPSGLPWISIAARHLRDKTDDAMDALKMANVPPKLFVRSGALTRTGMDEEGEPVIQTLTESALRGQLARCANFVEKRHSGDGGVETPVSPPLDVVRDIMALGSWPFPALQGIVEVPVITPSGAIAITPGYNADTFLFYAPPTDLQIPDIPREPTEAQRKAALALLQEVFCNFPFEDDESKANVLGLIITPIMRPMIAGPVPLALLDKPQAGTGASLLAEVVALVATGRSAAMMAAPKDEESWRKAITSLLMEGRTVITIDNIDSQLMAPSMAMALTSNRWLDRILGRSEMVSLPQRATWMATGNNIRLGGDLPRRCYWIRLDAQQARPWQRVGFKHPNLLDWVKEQRGAILGAILTLARAWIAAGKPVAKALPTVGGFEAWAKTIGGVLAHAGVQGFLGNLDRMYEESDDDTPQWEAFLGAWRTQWGDLLVTVAEVAQQIHGNEALGISPNEDLLNALPDDLAGENEKDTKGFTRRLGKALGKRAGMRYPSGLFIKKGAEKRRAIQWRVIQGEFGEFGEFVSPQTSLNIHDDTCTCGNGPKQTHQTHQTHTAGNGAAGDNGHNVSPQPGAIADLSPYEREMLARAEEEAEQAPGQQLQREDNSVTDVPEHSEKLSQSKSEPLKGDFAETPVSSVTPVTTASFIPSGEWQEVPNGVALPPGGEIRMDLAGEKTYARWPKSGGVNGGDT